MTLKLGQTRLYLHPLAIMFPLAAVLLGARDDAVGLMLALFFHEGAHLLAAKLLGVRVTQLRLMPFGGAIHLDNPYALPAHRLLIVAAAGPAANLLVAVVGAALSHWGLLSPAFALALLQCDLTLMLFNLLPALPLDGGRMLYALLAPHIGRERAVDWGIRIGRGVAAALLGLALYSALQLKRLNLSPAFAAIFILASAADERNALSGTRLDTVLSELQPLNRPILAQVYAVGGGLCVRDALRVARPDALTLYAVYDGSRLSSFTDDRRLLEMMVKRGAKTPVSESIP